MTKLTVPQQAKYLVEAKGPELNATPREMLESRRNKYLLVNMLAHRARELNKGERALIDLPQPHTLTEIVVQEVESDKLFFYKRKKSKVLVSLIKND